MGSVHAASRFARRDTSASGFSGSIQSTRPAGERRVSNSFEESRSLSLADECMHLYIQGQYVGSGDARTMILEALRRHGQIQRELTERIERAQLLYSKRKAATMKIGETGKDRITGFMGVCTARAEYITGCNQLLIQPKLDKDGGFVEGRWIDEDRVELVDAPIVSLAGLSKPGFFTPRR